ncbi:MAG: hypothetical protein UT02_C0023G0007 [Parcubacteria group bacterium GW2011_GWC2_38_7]|nr:MAG: hypothetical protein UT02_C0023G0007 [Parcubacteria group bacterium GW2011_GWC2_38_7]
MKTLITINQEVFKALLVLYLVLFVLEYTLSGFVSLYFNSSIILVALIISGCISAKTILE